MSQPFQPQTIINNQKWAYFGRSKTGRMVPRMGKPMPYFVKAGAGYREKMGDPTFDPLALAYMFKTGQIIMPGRSHLGKRPSAAPRNIEPRITFSEKGAEFQWPPAPEEDIQGYMIERSHEAGHPLDSFIRITASPVKQLTYSNLWVWEGESVCYRIYTVLADGSIVLRATLQGIQTPFTDKPITTQFIVTSANTSATKETVFRGLHFRGPERTDTVKVQTSNKVAFEDCTFRTSARAVSANGAGNVRLTNNYFYGQIPMTENYNCDNAFNGDYQRSFSANNNLVREMGGFKLGQWRGPTSAAGGPVTRIHGNIFWNLAKKRSNGKGGTYATDTIVTAHKENKSMRGRSNPLTDETTKITGYIHRIGWEFANALNLNGYSNRSEATYLPAVFFGGLDFVGNFMWQEPGIGLAEDAWNFYSIGGESNDRPVRVKLWCIIGNYGNGINEVRWQPGMNWPQGGQTQHPDGYFPGVTQPAGKYNMPYQSQTGGLMQDSSDRKVYANNGAYVHLEDFWLLGSGTNAGTLHSHDMFIRRGKVVYTGRDWANRMGISGDPRVGLITSNVDENVLVEGKLLWTNRGVSEVTSIMPLNSVTAAQGFWTKWLDPAIGQPGSTTFGNVPINRLATQAEEKVAYVEFLMACEAANIKLGPQYSAPAVVYS